MTDDTREPTGEPTEAELAAEPALPALGALALTPAAHDALARRIEAAAAGELARRALAHAVQHAPRGGRHSAAARAHARPALFAAAAAAVFAVGLARTGESAEAAGQQVSDATAVQTLNLHDPSAQWADQARAPSADALGRAIGLGGAP